MNAIVQKWGNSAAVRLPAPLLKELNLAPGEQVAITVEDGRIVIAPVQHRYSLDYLLAGITPENRHEALDFGAAVGREAL